MKMSPLTLIKIGGSVITNKLDRTSSPQFKRAIANRLALEFYKYLSEKRPRSENFVLVHGVGSFGHPLAKKYELHDIEKREKDKIGAMRTHNAVRQLNSFVADVFLKNNCPVYPISPLSVVQQSRGRIFSFDKEYVEGVIERGHIPLFYGDVVLDKACGFSICSGDQLVSYMSMFFPTKRVLFLTDVEGIFSTDPKRNKEAILFKKIQRRKVSKVAVHTNKENEFDVTNAMQGKLAEIADIHTLTYILNGRKKGYFYRALSGERIGTLVV